MQYGYSILFGDVVDAVDFSYDDCKELLLICPICREKIFKRVRGEKHFFSHHKRTDDNTTCDLRVMRMTKSELKTLGAITRGQTIEEFFKQVNQVILHSVTLNDTDRIRFENDIRQTTKNPNFLMWYRQYIPLLKMALKVAKGTWDNDPTRDRSHLVAESTAITVSVLEVVQTKFPYSDQILACNPKNSPIHMQKYLETFANDIGQAIYQYEDKVDWKFLAALFLVLIFDLDKPQTTGSGQILQNIANNDLPRRLKENYEFFCGGTNPDPSRILEAARIFLGSMAVKSSIQTSGKLKFQSVMKNWHKKGETDLGSYLMMATIFLGVGLMSILPLLPNFQTYMMQIATKQDMHSNKPKE